MKLKRKFFILATVISMTLCTAITSYAADYTNMGNQIGISENYINSSTSPQEIVEQLNNVDFGTDITFTEIPNSGNNEELIEFDSLEEAELYIQQFLEEREKYNQALEACYVPQRQNKITLDKVDNGWKEGTVSWWGGGNTSLLSMTNAMIRHYYKNGNISDITVKDSYMTGIVGATWTHRSGKATALGGTSIQVSVTGTWFIGMDIKGFPIGASFDETLESPTINVNVR